METASNTDNLRDTVRSLVTDRDEPSLTNDLNETELPAVIVELTDMKLDTLHGPVTETDEVMHWAMMDVVLPMLTESWIDNPPVI